MHDPFDPTGDEIEAWARTPDAMYPTEDWDLVVAADEHADLLLRLASDPSCVNHEACLNFLYVYAGQVVREGQRPESVALLRGLVARAATGSDAVRLWAERSTGALSGTSPDPRSGAARADYEFWFSNGWRRAR